MRPRPRAASVLEARPNNPPWPAAAFTLFVAIAGVYVYVAYHSMRGGTVAGLSGERLQALALLLLALLFLTGFLVGRMLRRRKRAMGR